jgi:LysR family transcriptional regulator, glycine cleavage system transcriptional activator
MRQVPGKGPSPGLAVGILAIGRIDTTDNQGHFARQKVRQAMARRRPPLNPIRAFETAARHLSFTAAAEELGITQIAVSRQVRVLEDYLEVALFERSHRSIRLTAEGARLFPATNRALDEINEAAAGLSMRGRRDVLVVQTYTTFAQRWLIPRLWRFHERLPNVEIRLSASIAPVDFERGQIHAAIQRRSIAMERCDVDFLAPVELLPVCSPTLVEGQGEAATAKLLARQSLLHSLARPNDWKLWLSSAGLTQIDPSRGMKFENSVLAYEAALQGIGTAMGIRVLVEQYLRSGSLVAPFGPPLALDDGYYLLIPRGRQKPPALHGFRDWLLEEAAKTVS